MKILDTLALYMFGWTLAIVIGATTGETGLMIGCCAVAVVLRFNEWVRSR